MYKHCFALNTSRFEALRECVLSQTSTTSLFPVLWCKLVYDALEGFQGTQAFIIAIVLSSWSASGDLHGAVVVTQSYVVAVQLLLIRLGKI